METCIRLQGVTKQFGHGDRLTHAVNGIDLAVESGEIVALLGPNGAGKTSTLDMILGFEPPTAGIVQVFGQRPSDAVRDGRVAAVLQSGGLLRDLTVIETIELVASTYPIPAPIDEVLARAGLVDLARRRVQACSGGEQQRLRFALALLAEPELLILDEPTAGMDVQARQAFWAAMRIEADLGRTVVFATHYLQEAEDFAERTVLMAGGRIVADEPTGQLRRQATGRRVAARFPADRVEAARHAIELHVSGRGFRAEGDRLIVTTPDSDALARLMLGELGGYDIEITTGSLEDAFVQLTQAPSPETRGARQ